MILTYGLKYDLGYVKGFSAISSKSIEHLQKRQEIAVISMNHTVVHPPYKNIFYGMQSGAVIMKGLRVGKNYYEALHVTDPFCSNPTEWLNTILWSWRLKGLHKLYCLSDILGKMSNN